MGAITVDRGLQHVLDEYLVLLAQAGDHAALARLAARWSPRLLAFAARSTGNQEAAQDAVQETWASAVRGLRRLEDPARFRTWIYAIAARKCADALRARYRGRRVAAALQDAAAVEPAAAGSAAEGADADAHLDLAAALERLPRDQRVAVALLYGQDMSVAEIAAVTGAPPGTVKSRLSAARQALRAHLQGEDHE